MATYAPTVDESPPGASDELVVDAHRRLRGPYTAGGGLVRQLVPQVLRRCPELLARHEAELLTVAPELRGVLPGMRDQRARFYPPARTERVAHGVTEFVGSALWAVGRVPCEIVLEHAAEADATDAELIAILQRRLDAGIGRVVERKANAANAQPAAEPAARFVATECLGDRPAWRYAYDALPADERAALHDARADALEALGEPSLRLGAIPFHRERGSDPQRALGALRWGLEHCMLMGFYEAALDLGRRARALLDWETAPEESWLVTAREATALIALGRPDEAVELCDVACAATTLPSVHQQVAYARAMLCTRFGDEDRRGAKACTNAAIALSVMTPASERQALDLTFGESGLGLIEMLRAELLACAGRTHAALDAYGRAIEADPHHAECYFERAAIHRRAGNLTAAAADYDAAIRLGPPFAEAHHNRGVLALERGDADQALADFGYVLELDPGCVDAYVRRAGVLADLGETDAAASDVEAGLAHEPGQPHLLYLQGVLAHGAGRDAQACAAYDAALQRDPCLTGALGNRAMLRFESGDLNGAIEDLTGAIVLSDDPALRGTRALALERAERYAEAIEECSAALEHPHADRASLLLRRGRCRLRAGNGAAAQADLAACAAFDATPDAVYARELLEAFGGRWQDLVGR